jgi:hypothetical protein
MSVDPNRIYNVANRAFYGGQETQHYIKAVCRDGSNAFVDIRDENRVIKRSELLYDTFVSLAQLSKLGGSHPLYWLCEETYITLEYAKELMTAEYGEGYEFSRSLWPNKYRIMCEHLKDGPTDAQIFMRLYDMLGRTGLKIGDV